MVNSRYAGAWRSRSGVLSDDSAPLGAAEPTRHMAQFEPSAHGMDDTAETRRAIQTSYALDAAPNFLFDPTDSSAALQESTVGVPIDLEPRDHANGDVEWSENNTQRDLIQPSPLHGRDRLSMWARKIRQPRSYQWDEKLTTPRIAANTSVDNSEALRVMGNQFAGTNAKNNPVDTVQRTRGDEKSSSSPRVGWGNAGPRVGFRVFRWDERKFPMHYVRHDTRNVPNHTAKTAQDTATPLQGNQYVSPFASLVNTKLKTGLTPMVRRQPNQWDQSVIEDGSESYSEESYNSWGL